MKHCIAWLAAVLLLSGLCGCTAGTENVENSKKLRVGMTKAEVLAIMGEPAKDEAFHRPDIWFYYFNMNWGDGFVTEDECFPLVFENGKLAGWGNAYYTRRRIEHKNRVPNVKLPENVKAVQGK